MTENYVELLVYFYALDLGKVFAPPTRSSLRPRRVLNIPQGIGVTLIPVEFGYFQMKLAVMLAAHYCSRQHEPVTLPNVTSVRDGSHHRRHHRGWTER
jgi:hypothetical protein